MKREDDEQLWDLLGHTAEPKISPFFARNVLRQIRQGSRLWQRFASWLSWRQLVPASALAAAAIAAIIVTHRAAGPQSEPDTAPDVVAKIDPQDYEVVADLDDLLASEENNLWDENSTL
jgi:hypothetical protein